jgi:hypothetical protein
MSGHFGALGKSANYPNERFVSTAPVFIERTAKSCDPHKIQDRFGNQNPCSIRGSKGEVRAGIREAAAGKALAISR